MIRPPFSRIADCAMENDGAKRVQRSPPNDRNSKDMVSGNPGHEKTPLVFSCGVMVASDYTGMTQSLSLSRF